MQLRHGRQCGRRSVRLQLLVDRLHRRSAVNYDEAATTDDGSCLFVGCTDPDGLTTILRQLPRWRDYPEACPVTTGDGEVDVNDLLDFFQLWGNFCE